VDEAIRSYDDEAQYPRDRYLGQSPTQRQQLLDFLEPRTPTNNAPNTFFDRVLRLRVIRQGMRGFDFEQTNWGKTLLWFSGEDPIGCQMSNRQS